MAKTTISISSFTSVAPLLPASKAILMRGPTGIGKSHLAKQIAEHHGLPFIDVRGSTMSEGDVGGYPDIEGMKESGVMTFCMPSWFVRACNEPVVLMLDELNRSLPGVQQSFFQLVLDRELGNDKNGMPYKLHPQTRVIAAVNDGSEYDVNDMDPALLRRFWVCDLLPTVQDWTLWAKQNDISPIMIDFINQNQPHFRVDPSQVEPGTVVPCPATWADLDQCLKHAGIDLRKCAGKPNPEGLYIIALGLVGVTAAVAFAAFVKEYDVQISAEDILDGTVTEFEMYDISMLNSVIDKLGDHSKDNKWTRKQAERVASFAKAISGEMMVSTWNKITSSQNLDNIQKIHKLMGQDVVAAVQASRNLGK